MGPQTSEAARVFTYHRVRFKLLNIKLGISMKVVRFIRTYIHDTSIYMRRI